MKFFNTRIVTKTVQLGDALKAEPKATRSLDEILADIQNKGQVKTASSAAQVKTASKGTTEETLIKQAQEMAANPTAEKIAAFKLAFQGPSVVAPTDISTSQPGAKAGDVTVEEGKVLSELRMILQKAVNPEVKAVVEEAISKLTSHPIPPDQAGRAVGEWAKEGAPGRSPGLGEAPIQAASNKETKEAKKKLPPEFLEHIKGKGKKEDKDEKKEDKKEDKEAKSAPRTLKMASSLDFRQWEAEDVVRAWGQHGSHDKCVANVKDLVNEPASYCKLLQVASGKAASIIKTASMKAEKKQASPKGVFKKLAKLSDEEASFLKEYWRNLYGDAYVESMMKDY